MKLKLVSIVTIVSLVALIPLNNSVENYVDEQIDNVEESVQSIVYNSKEKIVATKKEIDCLARNIYYESRSEPYEGKVAVANITINRLKDGRWGNDLCRVIFSKYQFSWTLYRNKEPYGSAWQESIDIAKEAINGMRVTGLEEAQYYHANYIKQPRWTRSKQKVQEIGKHIFYI